MERADASVGHVGDKLDADKAYLLFAAFVAKFLQGIFQVVRLGFFEVFVDVLHVVLVDDVFGKEDFEEKHGWWCFFFVLFLHRRAASVE